MTPQRRSSSLLFPGFTLVELMVSVSIIGLIMVVLLGMTNQISATWRSTTGKIEEFQQARNAFESMTRKLSQATLNTFWDMNFAQVGQTQQPTSFRRNSQLRFACGQMSGNGGAFTGLAPAPAKGHNYPTHGVFFQAPFGYVDDPGVQDMSNLLNTWGFFIDYTNDASSDPPFIANLPQQYPAQWGYRLTEFQQPTEYMSVYNWDGNRHDVKQYPAPTSSSTALGWFQTALTAGEASNGGGTAPPTRILAQNIIALIIWPKLSKEDEDYRRSKGWSTISPAYIYDSACTAQGMYTTAATNVFLNQGAKVSSVTNVPEVGGINPKNQLPPILQVTMVALDAQSAKRLVDPVGNSLLPTYDAFTTGLFLTATSVPSPQPGTPTQYDNDLGPATVKGTLEYRLTHPATISPALGIGPLKYRIFTTNVMIRSAKWSSYETN